jgi:hypothetical protein
LLLLRNNLPAITSSNTSSSSLSRPTLPNSHPVHCDCLVFWYATSTRWAENCGRALLNASTAHRFPISDAMDPAGYGRSSLSWFYSHHSRQCHGRPAVHCIFSSSLFRPPNRVSTSLPPSARSAWTEVWSRPWTSFPTLPATSVGTLQNRDASRTPESSPWPRDARENQSPRPLLNAARSQEGPDGLHMPLFHVSWRDVCSPYPYPFQTTAIQHAPLSCALHSLFISWSPNH